MIRDVKYLVRAAGLSSVAALADLFRHLACEVLGPYCSLCHVVYMRALTSGHIEIEHLVCTHRDDDSSLKTKQAALEGDEITKRP